jgi:hypothetical protein
LEESGQHILRVEVGYGGSDGTTKTLRKFYRFQVSNPLLISEWTMRTGDASCFVSISLENNALETKGGGLTICAANFVPAPGLSAERVGGPSKNLLHNDDDADDKRDPSATITGVELLDNCGRLESGVAVRYLFKVTATSKESALRGIAAGDELGKAVFTWRKAVGEMGRMASSPIICPPYQKLKLDPNDPTATMTGKDSNFVVYVHGSGLSVDVATSASYRVAAASAGLPYENNSLDRLMPITVEPIDPPTRMILAVPTDVQFLVVNHGDESRTLQIQFHLEHMTGDGDSGGLKVCGPSFQNLDLLPGSGGSTTVSVRFLPLAEGLMRVQGCCVVDQATGFEVPQPPLFHVFVEKGPDQ